MKSDNVKVELDVNKAHQKKEIDMRINLKEKEFELALEMLKTCAADHMALDPDERDFTWTEMKELIDKFEGAKT